MSTGKRRPYLSSGIHNDCNDDDDDDDDDDNDHDHDCDNDDDYVYGRAGHG